MCYIVKIIVICLIKGFLRNESEFVCLFLKKKMKGKIVVEKDYLYFMFVKGFFYLYIVLLEFIIKIIYSYFKCIEIYLLIRWKRENKESIGKEDSLWM